MRKKTFGFVEILTVDPVTNTLGFDGWNTTYNKKEAFQEAYLETCHASIIHLFCQDTYGRDVSLSLNKSLLSWHAIRCSSLIIRILNWYTERQIYKNWTNSADHLMVLMLTLSNFLDPDENINETCPIPVLSPFVGGPDFIPARWLKSYSSGYNSV